MADVRDRSQRILDNYSIEQNSNVDRSSSRQMEIETFAHLVDFELRRVS